MEGGVEEAAALFFRHGDLVRTPLAASIPYLDESRSVCQRTLRGCFRTRSVGPRPNEAAPGKVGRRVGLTEAVVEEARRSTRSDVVDRSPDGVLKHPLGLVLLLLTSAVALDAGQSDGTLDVYWTDVEGGAATLVVTPAGESVLIDTGLPGDRDPYRICRTVTQHAGLERIDHLIITHFDVDHFGGAADLAERIFIGRVWDPGIPELDDRRKAMIRRYLAALGGRRKVLRPGDRIPLRAATGRETSKLDLICLGAAREFVEAPDGARENPVCGKHTREKARDTSQNGESTALLLRFGGFELLDCGDLTWQLERRLVCPVNLVGTVDVFQVDHHGLDSSNNPVLVDSVKPRVAIMNNGSRKGCMPEVFATLTAKGSSIEALYQMHRNLRVGDKGNTAPELIANHAKDCTAEIIRLAVSPDSRRYRVEIPSSGHVREFAAR